MLKFNKGMQMTAGDAVGRAPRGSQTFNGVPGRRYQLRLELRAQCIMDGVYQTWRPGTLHRTDFTIPSGTVFTFIERATMRGTVNRVRTRIKMPENEIYGVASGSWIEVWMHDNHADANSQYNEERIRVREQGRAAPNSNVVPMLREPEAAEIEAEAPETDVSAAAAPSAIQELVTAREKLREAQARAAHDARLKTERALGVLKKHGFVDVEGESEGGNEG